MNSYPKIIHQIWISNVNDPVPEDWKESINSWKKIYSDYEYMLWDNTKVKELLSDHFPQYEKDYNDFKYLIQRVDFLKFLIMKEYGGIYSDLDLVPLKRFDELVNSSSDICLCKSYVSKEYYINGFFIGKPNVEIWDLFIKESIKRSNENKNYGKHSDVMRTTGSWMITDIINKYDKSISVLPSVFNPLPLTENSYFKALRGGSWLDVTSKIGVSAFRNRNILMLLAIIVIIILIILFVIYILKIKRKSGICDVLLYL